MRQARGLRPEVPLSVIGCVVADGFHDLRHSNLVGGESVWCAGNDHKRKARTNRVSGSHGSGARWSTAGFHQELGKPQPFRGKTVDSGRRCASQLTATVDTHIAVSQVVGHHKDNVGLFLRMGVDGNNACNE